MRRFRLINDSGYIGLVQGEVYEGRYIHPNTDSSVISCFNEYPEDWEEVFDPESLWISVKDRLPPDNMEVLINYSGDVIQAFISGGTWKGSCDVTDAMNDGYVNDRTICKHGGKFDFVTHWTNLPDSPKQ